MLCNCKDVGLESLSSSTNTSFSMTEKSPASQGPCPGSQAHQQLLCAKASTWCEGEEMQGMSKEGAGC